jgi:hypothetical protein
LLLAANIGFFAWQYQARGGLAGGSTAHEDFQPTDAGVAPLTLLSERPAPPLPPPAVTEPSAETMPLAGQPEETVSQPETAEGVTGSEQTVEPAPAEESETAPPEAPPPPAPAPGPGSIPAPQPAPAGRCFELGPSEDQALIAQAESAAQQAGARTNIRVTTRAGTGGYWVRLPDYFSIAEARAKYRELQQQGVDDVAIVPLPDRRYFISLGVYKQKDTMEERRNEVIAKGVTPIVDDRSGDVKLYTLAFEYGASDPAPLRVLQRTLAKQAPQVDLQEVACQ